MKKLRRKDILEPENINQKKEWLQNIIHQYNLCRMRPVAALLILLFVALCALAVIEPLSILQISVLCPFLSCFLSVAFILQRRWAILLYTATSLLLIALSIIGSVPVAYLLFLLAINWASMVISPKAAEYFIQITDRNCETIHRLQIEAQTDWLTGALNRNGMEKRTDVAWAFCKRYQKLVGFLMVDIDHFKGYNDALGHDEGDNILRSVGDCIKACFKRETDIVGRIGGEEFLICIMDSTEQNILAMARTLCSRIAGLEIRSPSRHSEFLTVSIGAAICIPQDHSTKQDLYIQADRELYHAKNNGRNCISFKGQIIKGDG